MTVDASTPLTSGFRHHLSSLSSETSHPSAVNIQKARDREVHGHVLSKGHGINSIVPFVPFHVEERDDLERTRSRPTTPLSDYGAVEDWEDLDEDLLVNLDDDLTLLDDNTIQSARCSLSAPNLQRMRSTRRWSVLEKLNRRYYCRVRSCQDLARIVNSKCLFSTMMLAIFLSLLYFMTKALLFNKTFEPQTFDFIVVGAGSAGSVISRKLLDSGAKVLVLEAGNATQYELGGLGYSGSPLTVFDIPLLWTAAMQFPDHIWNLHQNNAYWSASNAASSSSSATNNNKGKTRNSSEKSKPGSGNELSTDNGNARIDPVVPKGLGGGGSMNSMVYTTALEADVRRWAIPRISWSLLNETYRELETFYSKSPSHGGEGPIGTSPSFYKDELSAQFIQSAHNAGIPLQRDFNDPNTNREGVGYYQFRIKNGVRSSAAQALLGPLLKEKRSDFTLELNAVVRRILLLNADPKSSVDTGAAFAYGVEYEVDGVQKTALLGQSTSTYRKLKKFEGSRSIILAAGAIMTPNLLFESGIGDPAQLQAARMPSYVSNRQVGKNLQDHPTIFLGLAPSAKLLASFPTSYALAQQWMDYFSAVAELKNLEERGITLSPATLDELMKKVGVLGSPGFSAGGFLRSPFARDNAPDLQLTLYPTVELAHPMRNRKYDFKAELEAFKQKSPVIFAIALMNPDMRYRVDICEDNDQQYPCVAESKPLSDHDIAVLSWGLNRVRDVIQSPPFSDTVEEELIPGKHVVDDVLVEWIRRVASPSSDWTSSCRVGVDSSDSALDPQFNVRGVRGLKVVDASAIPSVPNGNVGATVTAFASIAADLIIANP